MFKRKAGLQKEVSKIFTGIQIPGKNVPHTNTPPASPAPAPAKHNEPKPVPADFRQHTVPQPEQDIPAAPAPVQKVSEPPVSPKKISESPAPVRKINEPPAPVPKVYEPPVTRQEPHFPPAPARSTVKQLKQETLSKSAMRIPGLKILEKLKGKLLAPKPGATVNAGRHKAMILLMPVLLIVFIVVLMHPLGTTGRKSVKNKGNSNASSSVAFGGKVDWELPPVYPENLRDPMVFGSTAQSKETPDRPVVKGIVYSEDNPCAVVGDRIVTAGDVVQGATVVKINSDSVEFTKGDETWTQKVEH